MSVAPRVRDMGVRDHTKKGGLRFAEEYPECRRGVLAL